MTRVAFLPGHSALINLLGTNLLSESHRNYG